MLHQIRYKLPELATLFQIPAVIQIRFRVLLQIQDDVQNGLALTFKYQKSSRSLGFTYPNLLWFRF